MGNIQGCVEGFNMGQTSVMDVLNSDDDDSKGKISLFSFIRHVTNIFLFICIIHELQQQSQYFAFKPSQSWYQCYSNVSIFIRRATIAAVRSREKYLFSNVSSPRDPFKSNKGVLACVDSTAACRSPC